MAQRSVTVRVLNLDSVLKKLDARYLLGPGRDAFLRDLADTGRREVLAGLASHWSARSATAEVRDDMATVYGPPTIPYKWVEGGTVVRGVQHVRARRFMLRAKNKMRRDMPRYIRDFGNAVEKRWDS